MKKNTAKTSQQQLSLSKLITAHREFQLELDIITSANNNPDIIDALIEIRKFNINCISRYSAMLVKSDIDLTISNTNPRHYFNQIQESESLWQIREHILKMISTYSEVMISGEINEFNRMIIARNFDKMVLLKENLLHPIVTV